MITTRRIAVVLTILLSGSVFANAQTVAIRAGRLVDPELGTTAANQVIVVRDGKITDVGGDVAVPKDATVIDLSKAVVLPGLIDSHTHMLLSMDRGKHFDYYHSTLMGTTAYRTIEGVANARAMLMSGFTTIRDMGNTGNHGDTDLRRAIEAGIVPGPTIINAGRIIAPFGGQLHLQPERPDLGEPEYFFADTPDELIKAVRRNIHFGALIIKIVVDDQKYIYSVDDIRTVVDEADRAGLKVAAHCVTEQGFRNAAEAGVTSIEHGFEASDEALMIAKEHGVVLVGTELTPVALTFWGEPEAFRQRIVDRARRAYRLGLKLAFGSDAFFWWPGMNRGELSLTFVDPLVEAGYPPAHILKMMTIYGAELLGVDDERGTIAQGYMADIIATAENPLDDIASLERVVFVMKDGSVYRGPGVAGDPDHIGRKQ